MLLSVFCNVMRTRETILETYFFNSREHVMYFTHLVANVKGVWIFYKCKQKIFFLNKSFTLKGNLQSQRCGHNLRFSF